MLNISNMRSNLTSVMVVLASVLLCVRSAPARPLNERSTELTWQAWLLVDDQNNQHKQYDPENLMRRRITPKSVFIAPTFKPESLPACADGYTSDPMGRCIKIVQLDTAAQLDFILDRLKQQFGTFDEYEDEPDENLPTPGPFQFNIPLDEASPGIMDEDTNVAIVVAPTNGNFNLSKNITNIKRDQNHTSQADVPFIITKINIADDETTTTTTTTTTEEATTITTTEIITSTMDVDIETTTNIPTTTEEDVTTTEEPQAIFFKIPVINETTTPIIEPIVAENKLEESYVQALPYPEIATRFRDDTQEIVTQLLPHANVKSDAEKLFDDYISGNEDDQRHHYKNRDTAHQENHLQTVHRVFNHRNRDRWLFPPTWRDAPPQKPLVLRFNNLPDAKHGGHFYQHHPKHSESLYRQVPPEDLSYIFGFKRSAVKR